MTFKFEVRIMPRPESLDPQGRAVEQTLKRLSYSISQCRVGKQIELVVEAADKEQAQQQVQEMVHKVLYNPLLEVFEVKSP